LKTSLYNHNSIDDGKEPLIPNIIFKGLLHLVDIGDFEAADYIIKNYTLTEYQKHVYEQLKKQDTIKC